jgi:AraC-like DNA-binding protein
MQEILHLIDSLMSSVASANGKSSIQGLGVLSCANAVHIKHVPFHEPCIVLVLSGRKVIYDATRPISCEAGGLFAVPAPASFDLRNEPDARSHRYRALIIPFAQEMLERLGRAHSILHDGHKRETGILTFELDGVLTASIKHYLTSIGNERLRAHRLMEILLLLVSQNPALLSYVLNQRLWSQRVRAVVASDLAAPWDINTVCMRLATSESALRRHLKLENTGYRELLQEMRLTTALIQLMQTTQPVYQIAYDCGYQSVSRFTSNFHRRFGLPPRAFRDSVEGSEQNLAVSAHPRA